MTLPQRIVDSDFKQHKEFNEDFGEPSGIDVDFIDTIACNELLHVQDQNNLLGTLIYLSNKKTAFYSKRPLRNCRSFKGWLLITSGPVYILVNPSWTTLQNGILSEDQLKSKICSLFRANCGIDVYPSSFSGILSQKSKQIPTINLFAVLNELFPVCRVVMMGMQMQINDIPDSFNTAMSPYAYPQQFVDGKNSFDFGVSTRNSDRVFLFNLTEEALPEDQKSFKVDAYPSLFQIGTTTMIMAAV